MEENSTVTRRGTLLIATVNPGSKSEGKAVFLKDGDDEPLRLYRAGVYEVGDPYFRPFDGKEVAVTGVREANGYLRVENIEEEPVNPVEDNE